MFTLPKEAVIFVLGPTDILVAFKVVQEILSVTDTFVAFRVAPEIVPIVTISPGSGWVNTFDKTKDLAIKSVFEVIPSYLLSINSKLYPWKELEIVP